ncbi:ATP-dependent DNA helicase [Gulosibacter molinativorax]|uniref:Helicase n=1 Tax=Gulosibacter molinativorax TaxID=256821 RepID=A0ABT7CBA3_9MICO|nr:AAA family ATPase [Gulosibacter molinativorax]MDJ1372089.1 helicase [Gulosibacter molinativorax]QUY62368.1 Helicase, putative [Gulosibacter molinativorax]
MASVDAQISSVTQNISQNIDELSHNRALLAQNLLAQLRNLVEAVAVRLQSKSGDTEFHYDATGGAVEWLGSQSKDISFLYRFHKLLQKSASHYTFEGDASERLMLKYYEYLLRTRALLQSRCGINTLENLERFPVDLDDSLKEYHQKIAERIDAVRNFQGSDGVRNRYYIHRVRPFFVDGRILYEVTFSNAVNKTSKFDRIIAFTEIDMTGKYAANLTLISDAIQVLDQTMPILVVQKWEVSIRPCEMDNFARLLGHDIKVNSGSSEYRMLMQFLTDTSSNLLDLMDMPDARYRHIRAVVVQRAKRPQIFPALDSARAIISINGAGTNVLRYLMLRMNNQLLKSQYEYGGCGLLSNLNLPYGCKPFDDMPFCTSLPGHNPRIGDLLESIDASGRTHEFLARRVKTNVERYGRLYTPLDELESLGNLDELLASYDKKLYYKHTGRKLVQDKGHIFQREYEDDTVRIIEKIQEHAKVGVDGYQAAVTRWLEETQLDIDDDAKVEAMKSLFARSSVALIYGAAGTGKSTMINYIANYFAGNEKLLLAHTNPAKDNLQRRVSVQHAEFRTISSQIYRTGVQREYDVLIIDECSTVSNSDLLRVLENTSFKLLVLVGDVYQIESIQFGNWFSIIRSLIPKESVFELETPYRTKNPELLDFWSKVRLMDQGIEESIAQNQFSTVLDQSLFEAQREDEIVLCLNYDGLYGINNVNRFLQSSNPGKAATWGVNTYKVDDPILFNEIERFKPVIFNNLKGRIVDIVMFQDHIQFDVWLDRSVTAIDVDGEDLRFVDDSTVRFDVYQTGNTDDDDDSDNTTVPFQVAYAVSIHKAQGLEYDSVKVVVTDANEEDFSHSIFYTAITRARERLKVFWTPETQKAIIDRLVLPVVGNSKDIGLLKARRGISVIR